MFGLAIDFVMREVVDKSNRGNTLIPKRSSRYPEVLCSRLCRRHSRIQESDTRMAETIEAIRTAAGKLGLQMNFKETELTYVNWQVHLS